MNPSFLWLRIIGGLLLTATVVAAAVGLSWRWAEDRNGGKPRYLRWHIIAKSDIPQGAQLREENVGWKLGWVPDESQFYPKAILAIGQFAKVKIDAGTRLNSYNLQRFALATAPENGAVVPVEIKTEHAGGLQPGMKLAFVHNKEMLPASKEGEAQRGFEVLCITTSQRDPAITTLMVKVEPSYMVLLPSLATEQWRPVVLSDVKVDQK